MSPEYNEMSAAFGDPQIANRIVNALCRSGIESLEQLDAREKEMGRQDFTLFLWCIKNMGELSIQRTLDVLDAYRNKTGA